MSDSPNSPIRTQRILPLSPACYVPVNEYGDAFIDCAAINEADAIARFTRAEGTTWAEEQAMGVKIVMLVAQPADPKTS